MMGWYHDGLSWGGWLILIAAMVAFWALVVLAVVALFRTESAVATRPRTPEQVLDERFARGELGTEEYQQAYTALHHPAGRP